MKNHFKLVVVVVIVCNLASCVPTKGPSGLVLRDPPTLAIVKVSKPTCGGVSTQTIAPTCPFIGSSDPVDIVCQNPSISSPPKNKIKWTSSDGEFTLEFPDGNPFASTNSRNCRISTKGTEFTCVIRPDTPSIPSSRLLPVYKYNVVFDDGCRLDPFVILTR